MEGVAGTICFLSDLYTEKEVKFPGYEV